MKLRKKVRDLLDLKGREIWSITPETTVFHALVEMAEKNVGALLVMEGDEILGIVSERDYARKVVLQGKTSRDTTVAEVMTKDVIWISPDNSIEECMGIMTAKRIRHLPVREDDKLIGIISIGDVGQKIIEEQKIAINHLLNFIRGV